MYSTDLSRVRPASRFGRVLAQKPKWDNPWIALAFLLLHEETVKAGPTGQREVRLESLDKGGV